MLNPHSVPNNVIQLQEEAATSPSSKGRIVLVSSVSPEQRLPNWLASVYWQARIAQAAQVGQGAEGAQGRECAEGGQGPGEKEGAQGHGRMPTQRDLLTTTCTTWQQMIDSLPTQRECVLICAHMEHMTPGEGFTRTNQVLHLSNIDS